MTYPQIFLGMLIGLAFTIFLMAVILVLAIR